MQRALVAVQVAVPRAHGQPVLLAHDRRADDVDLEVQVADHAADERQLLVILLAEDCDVRVDDHEELQDDGRDAAKVTGTMRAAERLREPLHRDRRLRPVRVDVVRIGREEHVDTRGGEERAVMFQVARIAREVVGAVELRGVDEDRGHDEIGVPPRDLDQRRMPGMERAHRRHERDARVLPSARLATP